MNRISVGAFALALVMQLAALVFPGSIHASTYVVAIPLDSPIYEELDTLNGLGHLDTYLDEIKPISRIEAARLTVEAESHLAGGDTDDPLAQSIVGSLAAQLSEEVEWLRTGTEDARPTTLHPLGRLRAQYIYSAGRRRFWRTSLDGRSGLNADEGTPLLADSAGIPTGAGSNEVVSYGGWAGIAGMFSAYGEVAATGPVTHSLQGASRLRPLGCEAVLSLTNLALSFGQQEMSWGVGHFAQLSQGDNSAPIPGLRVQSTHPTLLPWVLRYLGQFRYEMLVGELDGERYFSHPWIAAQIFSFKPLPNFEFGIDHAITFGGLHNDSYTVAGFFGRLTGLATGSAAQSNTNSRAGIYLKFRFPGLRDLQVYQEILGEDNLAGEVALIGGALPFLAVSYQGGIYFPRLTIDGRTDLRIEYTILEPNYSIHSDSLYWTYNGSLMGDPMGPNASRIDIQLGRWTAGLTRVSGEAFYTERAPSYGGASAYPARFYGGALSKERSFGLAFELWRAPKRAIFHRSCLSETRLRMAFERVIHANYGDQSSFRTLLSVSTALAPDRGSVTWP